MSRADPPASPEAMQRVVDAVLPGHRVVSVRRPEGDISNTTVVVESADGDGEASSIVLRLYATFGHYDRGEKAAREFGILRLLHRSLVPVPEPLFLDTTGAVLGSPGIVSRFVAGRLLLGPPYPVGYARKLAATLAAIHAVEVGPDDVPNLLDADSEVTWFLATGEPPDYLRSDPRGAEMWDALQASRPAAKTSPPSLVHIDYWAGNVLWDDEGISAVLDWEEAALGDPVIDVAYCRMDMMMSGLEDVAEEFLHAYEEIAGPVTNLGFWELSAAVRPLFGPWDNIHEPDIRGRFDRFIDGALHRTREK